MQRADPRGPRAPVAAPLPDAWNALKAGGQGETNRVRCLDMWIPWLADARRQAYGIRSVQFDWHDAKHERNRRERGLGFDLAALMFLRRVLTQVDDRREYGEVRWIISARRANRRERAPWLGR